MIRIECVNDTQREMLDKIWSCTSLDEFLDWSADLEHDLQELAITLAQMLKLAIIDQEVLQMMSTPDVDAIMDQQVQR